MKNLTKNSVANVAKVGVASALIGAGLFLSACGSGDARSKAESFIKQKYPDAKILSFSEIQKEFGLKDKECLNLKKGSASVTTSTYHFVKMSSGELSILMIMTDDKNGASIVDKEYTLDSFKERLKHTNPNCF